MTTEQFEELEEAIEEIELARIEQEEGPKKPDSKGPGTLSRCF